jgi:hypothetical protein
MCPVGGGNNAVRFLLMTDVKKPTQPLPAKPFENSVGMRQHDREHAGDAEQNSIGSLIPSLYYWASSNLCNIA